MSLRRLAFAVLGIGLLVGGCAPGVGRLDVTPALRAACLGFVANDAQIEALITEQMRVEGTNKWDAIDATFIACDSPYPDIRLACQTCGIALIDQVYGE
jgi:hypothetical protein